MVEMRLQMLSPHHNGIQRKRITFQSYIKICRQANEAIASAFFQSQVPFSIQWTPRSHHKSHQMDKICSQLQKAYKNPERHFEQVLEVRELPDPPLLRLENEAGNAYLSMLSTLYSEGQAAVREGARVETRLLEWCNGTLDSFEVRHSISSSCCDRLTWVGGGYTQDYGISC